MSIRLSQALLGAQFRLSRSKAFANTTSFLMMTVRASFAGFPARTSSSYLAFRAGSRLEATNAGM